MSSKKPPTTLALNKRLLSAAEDGDHKAIAENLDMGANLECKKSNTRNTPLLICCEREDLANIRELVRRGANVNAQNANLKTPLIIAIGKSNVEMIRFFIAQEGIDANIADPLCQLIESGSIRFEDKCSLASDFLKKGAKLTCDAFYSASNQYKSNPEYRSLLKLLVSKSDGADVKVAAEQSNALLMLLIAEGSRNTSQPLKKQFKITEMVLDKGANINCRVESFDQVKRTQVSEPLFVKLCSMTNAPLSTIDFVLHHKNFVSTDSDIENARGDVCKIFQLNHEMKKTGNPMVVENNQDLIEMMFGRLRSSSRSSSRSRSGSRSSKGGSRSTRKR